MAQKPLSILFVSTYLSRGGAERFVSTLLHHLDRDLFAPALCVLRDDLEYPVPDDVPVDTLGFRRAWQLPWVVRRLRRRIDRTRPAIVLGNVNATNLAVGEALRGCRHRPVWIARMGSAPSLHDRALRRLVARRNLPRADRFVVNARGMVPDLVEQYPFAEGRVEVLANPVDFERIDRLAAEPPPVERSGPEPLLVAVGRLSAVKRYDLILEALARVRAERPASLWICGDGPQRGTLERQIGEAGLGESVRLLGFLDNPFALVRQADLFVMASEYEGLPNALIEAQGLGLPAVASRCRFGPEEIIEEGITGLLVPIGDAEALGDAILELLTRSDRLRSMASAAQQRTRERFGAAKVSREWERLLMGTQSISE